MMWAMEFRDTARCLTSVPSYYAYSPILYGKVGLGDTKCLMSVPLYCACSHTSWCGGPRSSGILRRVFHYNNNIIMLVRRVITLVLVLHGVVSDGVRGYCMIKFGRVFGNTVYV